MSEFDNLYLCPICDNVAPLHTGNMICDECGFKDCYVARHVNEGTRKFWIKKEETLGDWRFEKRFLTMIKNGIAEDKELVKAFNKSVKELFRVFKENKNNLERFFPKYVRDYKRTTGRRETGWRHKSPTSMSVSKQKQNSLRGMIYEGAMNKFCAMHDLFDPILIPIPFYDKQLAKHYDYEPDFWFYFNELQIPVEFKTYEKGGMVKSKFIQGIKQSRRYGNLSFLTHINPNKYSAIIVCCPEERKFSCALVDENAKRI
jgi:hypothetical protein